MDSHIKPITEIHEGAVLVVSGQHKGRVGFYCLQNEQTHDMGKIACCPDCELTKERLKGAATNVFDSLLEIETGSYCESHRRALVDNDMAVIYWDKPYQGDCSLIHPSELVQIPSTEYARYERECKRDVQKAFSRSLQKMNPAKTSKDNSFRFQFKLAKPSQRQLIHDWLAQEHINQWLHGDGLSNTHQGLDEFFGGSSWAQHWIAYDRDTTPFAYLLTSDEGKDSINLDLFICDLNYLGKGFGVQLIQEFLISQFSNKSEVLIDPEATNTRAIHVYQKVGFRTVGTFIAPWHQVPHYKMRLDMKELMQKHHKD